MFFRGLPDELWGLIYEFDPTHREMFKHCLVEIKNRKRIYYKNGTRLFLEYQTKHGKKHGTYREYHFSGNKKIIAYYQEDLLQGLFLEYYPSGKLYEISFFKNEKLCGPLLRFYENGRLERVAFYNKHSNLEGYYTEYFPCGQILKSCVYLPGAAITTNPS